MTYRFDASISRALRDDSSAPSAPRAPRGPPAASFFWKVLASKVPEDETKRRRGEEAREVRDPAIPAVWIPVVVVWMKWFLSVENAWGLLLLLLLLLLCGSMEYRGTMIQEVIWVHSGTLPTQKAVNARQAVQEHSSIGSRLHGLVVCPSSCALVTW